MAAREPAMVSRIFSPAAAALDLADAPPPPNLRPCTGRDVHSHDSQPLTFMGLCIRMYVGSIVFDARTDILTIQQALETLCAWPEVQMISA